MTAEPERDAGPRRPSQLELTFARPEKSLSQDGVRLHSPNQLGQGEPFTNHLTSAVPIEAFKAAREEARLLAEEASNRMAMARSFVAAAISHYCDAGPQCPVKILEHPLAAEIGTLARSLDSDLAGYLLGTIYTVMVPQDYRRTHGVFYTPPSASDRLIQLAEKSGVSWCTARVADISCGGGAFLAPVARRMLDAQQWSCDRAAAEHLKAHLRGFELDSFSAWISEVFLNAVFLSKFRRSRCCLSGFVEVGDSLRKPLADFGVCDLVIGNPPYGKITLSAEQRDKFARSLFGHANLYGLFTDLALRLLSPKGTVAYVTPASFLGGQYFQSLRALLGEEAPPSAIDFLASRDGVFADVLQETVLVTFQRGSRRHFPVSFTDLTETGTARVLDGAAGTLPDNPAQPWLLPRSAHQTALLAAAKLQTHRLSDYGYEVSTGPLVWNRHKDRIGHSHGAGCVPIVWAESVCPMSSGEFTLKAATRNHAAWYRPRMEMDSNVVRSGCVLVQRTTSKEQRRRVIAAALAPSLVRKYGGVAVENHLNMVRVKRGAEPLIEPVALAALLNSEPVDQIFRCINGSTAVSAYELESIPLPAPERLRPLSEMVRQRADRAAIDSFIMRLYANVRIDAAA